MFSHENLTVYKRSVQFVITTSKLSEFKGTKEPLRDQLERAASSIPLNIAEGNGKFTKKDKCRFLDIARGSAMECAACLDILHAKGKIPDSEYSALKQTLDEIVSMLVGLIRATSDSRRF